MFALNLVKVTVDREHILLIFDQQLTGIGVKKGMMEGGSEVRSPKSEIFVYFLGFQKISNVVRTTNLKTPTKKRENKICPECSELGGINEAFTVTATSTFLSR